MYEAEIGEATFLPELATLAARLAGEHKIGAACTDALDVAMSMTRATCGEVFFRTATSHQLVCIASTGEYPWCVSQSGGRSLGSTLVELPLQEQVSLRSENVGSDSRLRFDLPDDAALRQSVSVPLVVRGRALGALNLCGTADAAMGDDIVGAIEVVAGLLAPVIENLYVSERATSEETERRQVLVRELEASEDERRRISRELHDGVGQTLTGLAMTIDGALARVLRTGADAEVAEMLQRSRDASSTALRDIRRVILALRPPALDDMGLFAALEAYAARTLRDAAVELVVRKSGRTEGLPPLLENVVFRVAQEAINNVARHSAANSCRLTLAASPARLRVCVEDDGMGFEEVAEDDGHYGFKNMRERAELVGGKLLVSSRPGKGSRVELRVSLKGGRDGADANRDR